MIEFICPRCDSTYQADDRFAGRVVTCRSCGAKIDVNKSRAEPARTNKLDESISAIQNSVNSNDTVSLTFIDEAHKKTSPDDTVVELSSEDLVPTARIPAADAPAPFGDPIKPPKEKKSKPKKEAPQPIIFLDSETAPETVDAILGPGSNLGSGAKNLRPGFSRDDNFRGNDDTRLDGLSGIILGVFGVIALAALARALMITGKNEPGFSASNYVGQIVTCSIGLFLMLGPMTLLGVFITSRVMKFHLPGASYLRACAAAAAPASLVMLALIFGAPIGLVVMLAMAGFALSVVMIHMTFAMRGGETVLAALTSLICVGVGGTAFLMASVSLAESMGVPREYKPVVARVTPTPPPVVARTNQPKQPTSIFDSPDTPVTRTTPPTRTTNGGTSPTQTPNSNDPAQVESVASTIPEPAPAASESWDLKPEEHVMNGEEASFGPFKFETGDARLDLTDINDPDRTLRFVHDDGAVTFEFVDLIDPSQRSVMVARTHAALESTEAEKQFVIDATGKSKVEGGLINGAPFTRVAQDGGEIVYATRFDSGWLVARVDGGMHRDELERVVRSVRYASDEPPASPLATEAIIRRLADSPAEAREILIARGRDIEDRLIQALRARNLDITPGLIEVLDAVGSPKAYDVLFAIARDDLDPSWAEARRTLRKIAPLRFDGVAEAMLDIDSTDLARRDEAVRMLALATPDDRRRDSVVEALLELSKANNLRDIELEVGAALAVWKTPATTKYFSELVENERSDRQQIRIGLAYLGRLRDPSFMAKISRWAPKEPDAVRAALIYAGPVAEGEALLMLKIADINLRRLAIEILAEVGTERSLGTLEALKKDIELGGAAMSAADSIRRRTGK